MHFDIKNAAVRCTDCGVRSLICIMVTFSIYIKCGDIYFSFAETIFAKHLD